MVAIPLQNDPTLEAMKRVCEERAAKVTKERDYLGASLIGEECVRKVWYSYNHYPRQPFSASTLWNFEDGHRIEDIIADRLRLIPGIQLWTHQENGQQYGFSALNGKFRGHVDGVIKGLLQAPKAPHVWENKCSAQKKFDEFKALKVKHGEKNTLKEWNYNYFVQAQLYMHYLQIDRHYMTVALAGGRDIDSCRTEYQGEVAEKYINRADSVLKAKDEPPRLSDKPDFWLCRFCDFKDVCHGQKDVTPVSEFSNRVPF